MDADVPEGWVTGEGDGEYEGLVYYYNEATGESTWDHPLDDYYRWVLILFACDTYCTVQQSMRHDCEWNRVSQTSFPHHIKPRCCLKQAVVG